jgi:predicted protein tyrosine phosphatase
MLAFPLTATMTARPAAANAALRVVADEPSASLGEQLATIFTQIRTNTLCTSAAGTCLPEHWCVTTHGQCGLAYNGWVFLTREPPKGTGPYTYSWAVGSGGLSFTPEGTESTFKIHISIDPNQVHEVLPQLVNILEPDLESLSSFKINLSNLSPAYAGAYSSSKQVAMIFTNTTDGAKVQEILEKIQRYLQDNSIGLDHQPVPRDVKKPFRYIPSLPDMHRFEYRYDMSLITSKCDADLQDGAVFYDANDGYAEVKDGACRQIPIEKAYCKNEEDPYRDVVLATPVTTPQHTRTHVYTHRISKAKLYLGGQNDVKDITRIVRLMEALPEQGKYDPAATVKHVAVPDNQSGFILFDEIIRWIDGALDAGADVLVHCASGVSRSSSVVLAYLMHKGMTLYDAFAVLKRKRPWISPGWNFVQQLISMETDSPTFTRDLWAAYNIQEQWHTITQQSVDLPTCLTAVQQHHGNVDAAFDSLA